VKKFLAFFLFLFSFTLTNSQVLSYDEWQELKDKARIVNSYSEITKNDSVIDLKNLDHGILCCKFCIGYISILNEYNVAYNKIYKEVTIDNSVEYSNFLAKGLVLNKEVIDAWNSHILGAWCKRGSLDSFMYRAVQAEVVNLNLYYIERTCQLCQALLKY